MAASADGLTLLSGRPGACYASPAGGQTCPSADETRLLTSSDGGSSWTERTGPGIARFDALAVSGNGLHMVAGAAAPVDNGDPTLWISADGGVSWTQHTVVPPLKLGGRWSWKSLASSHDGTRLLALMHAGYPWCGPCCGLVAGGWPLAHVQHLSCAPRMHPAGHPPMGD